MTSDLILPLEFLGRGEEADVVDVVGDADWAHRMAELGIQPGRRVRMLNPGSPCLVQVGDSRFCLRTDAGGEISVRPRQPEATQ